MKRIKLHIIFGALFCFFSGVVCGQSFSNNPAPYGGVTYGNVPCNQTGPSNSPGNFINDFIGDFNTTGANINIQNNNSLCNGLANNYIYYFCHYLQVVPTQTITCNVRSGIIFAQGFALFIDWNQNNVFDLPAERVGGTNPFPAANTWAAFNFVVPANQPNGTYRARLRCTWITNGNNILPTGFYSYGETEDYNVYIGPLPNGLGIVTATLSPITTTICAGQNLSFTSATTPSTGLTYTWTGPANYSATTQNINILNTPVNRAGTYTFVASNGSCTATETVFATVVAYPDYSLTPSTATVCQAGNTICAVTYTNGSNPNAFTYSWNPGISAGVVSPSSQSPLINPPLLLPSNTLSTMYYSVTVTPTLYACPITQVFSLTVNNPMSPTLSLPPPLCNTAPPILLTAVPGGGTWTTNPGVSPGGLLSPGLCTNGASNVMYSTSIGLCVVSSFGTIFVAQFNTAALTARPNTKCVQDPPFNLMNIVTAPTGTWSGTNVTNNIFYPASLPTGTYNLTYSIQSSPQSIPYATVCPDFTVIGVPIFNPPTPTIYPIPKKCDIHIGSVFSAIPTGGVWSGSSGVSAGGVQTPSLCQTGTNNVIYTAGQGTCVASSTATFHVSQFNTAALSGTVGELCVTSNPVNLMNLVQNTTGGWNGINVGGTYTFSPNGLPTNSYVLTYTTVSSPPIPGLCDDKSRLVISVLNPTTPVISPAGPLCVKGGPVQLLVTPAAGYWVSAPYVTSGGVFIPSLAVVGNNPVQYIIGTPTCNATQINYVAVEDFVPATITNQIPDLCSTAPPFSLLPITLRNTGIWTGPGILASSFNPSVTNAGYFLLTYHTSSQPSGLCPDQATVAVKVYSLAPPAIITAGPFCNRHPPVQLQVNPVGGLFGGANTAAVSLGGLFNPALGVIGNNIISYSIASGPCLAYAQSIISIEKFVSADFEKYAGPFCMNDKALDLNSLVQNPGGLWSGPGMIGSMFYPEKANSGDNNFIIYQTHSFPSAMLCPDSSAIRIKVYPTPTVVAVSNTLQGCAPLQVQFNTQSVNTGKGLWNMGDGSLPQSGLANINHVFTAPGSYSVLFVYSNEVGCSTQVYVENPITVFESPQANFVFDPDELSIANPEVRILNLSTVLGDNLYQWQIQGVDQNFYELSPKVTLPNIGVYQVRLKATSVNGCKDEIMKSIEVKNDFNVYIPNSFSPNADGLNDVFKPVFSSYGLDEKTFEMEIFDRWGHSVYLTKDHNKAWDGTLNNKGETSMKEDSYIYKIKFKDLDGRIYSKIGPVILIGN